MLLGLGCALIGDRCSESSERSLRPDQSVSYRSSQCRRQLPPSAIRVETVLRNHRLDRLMPPSTTNKLTAFVQTCLARAREVTAGDGPPPTLGAGNPPLKTRDNPLPGQAPSSPAGVARNGRPSRGTDTSTLRGHNSRVDKGQGLV
jgi:hypothetical protein